MLCITQRGAVQKFKICQFLHGAACSVNTLIEISALSFDGGALSKRTLRSKYV